MMKKAVELAPLDSKVLHFYAQHLLFTGKPGAMELTEKAYRLDPLSFEIMTFYTALLLDAGRQQDSQRVLEAYEGWVNPASAAVTYIRAGNLKLARQKLEETRILWGEHSQHALMLDYMLTSVSGDDRRARQIEQKLLAKMETEYVTFYFWGKGEIIKRKYELAYEQRQYGLIQRVRGARPPQISEEEWQTLRRNMNFEQLGNVSNTNIFLARSPAEIETLRANQIDVDLSVLKNYVGIYDAEGFGKLRFYVKEENLWMESLTSMLTVRHYKTIALDQNNFELENLKGFSYVFVDAQDYDMISVSGQITRYYKKVEP